MGKSVAIIQSSYLPWKGSFDFIRSVNEFIILDSVQYTRRDWRNRNKIKTPSGLQWIAVPVDVKGRFHESIAETRIRDPGWYESHWKAIELNYSRAAYWRQLSSPLKELMRSVSDEPYLSRVNEHLIRGVCEILGLDTDIRRDTDLIQARDLARMEATERLLALCRAAGATKYVSGPSARDYLEEGLFSEAGISVRYVDYSGYPEYPQLWQGFDHHLSIIDLLLNTGDQALTFMKTL